MNKIADYSAIKVGAFWCKFWCILKMNGKDKDEPYIVDFNYKENYRARLDDELAGKTIETLANYAEEKCIIL